MPTSHSRARRPCWQRPALSTASPAASEISTLLAPSGQSTPQGATRRNTGREKHQSFQPLFRVQVPLLASSFAKASEDVSFPKPKLGRNLLVFRVPSTRLPCAPFADPVKIEPLALVVRGVEPEHALEDGLGLGHLAEAPETESVAVHAAQEGAVVGPAPR